MKPPENLTRVVGRKRYSTRTGILLAGDDFWDGHNWERGGRNIFLYRTPKGAYFEVILTRIKGDEEGLMPLPQEEAIGMFEDFLTEHRVSFEEAFPGVEVTDA
jgi:hypothetical protein